MQSGAAPDPGSASGDQPRAARAWKAMRGAFAQWEGVWAATQQFQPSLCCARNKVGGPCPQGKQAGLTLKKSDVAWHWAGSGGCAPGAGGILQVGMGALGWI